MHRICTSLEMAGYEVTLVGRELKSSAPITDKVFRQQRLQPFFLKGKLFYAEYNIRLFFYLLFQRFDIVGGIDLDTILPCYFVARIKGATIVYDAHELFPEVPEVINRPVTQRIWQLVEKFAVLHIKNCYTVSGGLATYFSRCYGKFFAVIRNVPVLEEVSPAHDDPGEHPFIFYQGALNDGRGLEQLIAAMRFIPLQLKIAGEGDLSDHLRKLTIELQLQGKVHFLEKLLPLNSEKLRKKVLLELTFSIIKGSATIFL